MAGGEDCPRQSAREPSPGNYVAAAEVLGPRNVGESYHPRHRKKVTQRSLFSMAKFYTSNRILQSKKVREVSDVKMC